MPETITANGAATREAPVPTHEQPEVAKPAATDGGLPIGSVESILTAAPKDLREDLLEVPEWACSVRLRSLTAAQQAQVKQVSIDLSGRTPDVVWAAMEKRQFEFGVIEPAFTAAQVEQLHASSGTGFARVIARLDEISGMSKEDLRKSQNEFRESKD